MTVDIHLKPPADRYRKAQVFVDFWGRDEENVGKDEIHNPDPEYFEMELGPDKVINSTGRTYKWVGEMRLEYSITVRLLVNNTIDLTVQGLLYEGTTETNTRVESRSMWALTPLQRPPSPLPTPMRTTTMPESSA